LQTKQQFTDNFTYEVTISGIKGNVDVALILHSSADSANFSMLELTANGSCNARVAAAKKMNVLPCNVAASKAHPATFRLGVTSQASGLLTKVYLNGTYYAQPIIPPATATNANYIGVAIIPRDN